MPLEIQYYRPDQLKPYPQNARTHTAKQVEKICKSIREYGFTNPILIDQDREIIAGHGRLEAAKKLGVEEVPCIELSSLTDEQKKAYVLADNKIALDAGWDEDLLKQELESLEGKIDLTLTGFSEDELDALLSEITDEPEIEFSEELGESHNYILLKFTTKEEWEKAIVQYKLPKVYSKRADGKPWSMGIGRVINGKDYLK